MSMELLFIDTGFQDRNSDLQDSKSNWTSLFRIVPASDVLVHYSRFVRNLYRKMCTRVFTGHSPKRRMCTPYSRNIVRRYRTSSFQHIHFSRQNHSNQDWGEIRGREIVQPSLRRRGNEKKWPCRGFSLPRNRRNGTKCYYAQNVKKRSYAKRSHPKWRQLVSQDSTFYEVRL